MVKRPWSIQVELVEGCNRYCSFCGIQSIRKKAGEKYNYMTEEIALKAIEGIYKLNKNARIEFAMHGEPLLHKNHLNIFATFREYLPNAQMQITTNGKLLIGDLFYKVNCIFASGIDFIVLDTYEPEREKLREEAFSVKKYFHVLDFYDDCIPKGISPYANHKRKLNDTIILMDDLFIRNGEHPSRKILNHAGNNGIKINKPLNKVCTNPFREISICYNGNVNICCMDWKHEYICGNINQETLSQIWYGEMFEKARYKLYSKDRNFNPCSKCNKNSGTRVGLLPKEYGEG